jgi:hypothetical protein
MQRIYSKRLYIVAVPQGISGFPQPSVAGIVTGARKRRDLLPSWHGKLNINVATFRMNDGHLPEYQPRGNIQAVTEFLEVNPWAEAIADSFLEDIEDV